MSDRPGREIPKEFREVATHLVDVQGWRYERTRRHPVLFPPDPAVPAVRIPTTPSDVRSFQNFVAEVRRRGGQWPPGRAGRT